MPARRVARKLQTATTLVRAGVLRPMRPDKLARVLIALRRWGETPAGGTTIAAIRHPSACAIIDERGAVTFGEQDRATNRLARGLLAAGVKRGETVAILCRNHRWFVQATAACSKLGVHVLYVNTAFAGPQIADVLRAEGVASLIHDEEFAAALRGLDGEVRRFVGWSDGSPDVPTLDEVAAGHSDHALPPPRERYRVVILTSGTTGTPKGALRHHPRSMDPAASLLAAIPLRSRGTTLIAAPLFHSWGLAHYALGLSLCSTLVLRRRFEPAEALAAVAEHRASAVIVAPVMLQRVLELDDGAASRHDLSALRVVASSGSALPGDLALRVMDRLGPVLYNLYGSTEVAWATIAGPHDLRAAPGTAGRPPPGTVVKVIGDDGSELPRGTVGRIFVGNDMTFDGYTGGGSRELLGRLVASGDLGHVDEAGRLFIDGRDDEMIVSGGENVFPREVEDLVATHPHIDDVAVIGVPDAEFGARLAAYVVLHPGTELTAQDVKSHVAANLARYKVPRDVIFVGDLPRTATGKVLKRELGSSEAPTGAT